MPATDPLHASFCRNIKQRRLELGLTQAEVAARLGVHKSQYANYEQGRAAPTLPVLRRFAEALNTSGAALLTDLVPQRS